MSGALAPGSVDTVDLLPNLGAEEGDDWRSYAAQPAVRSAAHLWCLLFGANTRLRTPDPDGRTRRPWLERRRNTLWPAALGAPPEAAAFEWLARTSGPIAWLNTRSLASLVRTKFDAELCGPSPRIVESVHDKAFAAEAALELGLAPRALTTLVEVLDPDALAAPDALLSRLERQLAAWPDWTRRSFTFKPRFGSSGRGRVGGRDRIDTTAVRGALPRFAARGGAIFEPWLERVGDYSVCVLVPGPDQANALPTLLGSLEMWVTAGGLYRGHCGDVDSRGRIYSGDREDETLRADAATVASVARSRGYFGPCGVDSFRYREPAENENQNASTQAAGGRERLRGAVEFNARPTMGLVTIGLVRRALPRVREALSLTPGDRCGFALTYHPPEDADWHERLAAGLGNDAITLDLSTGIDPADPRPVLAFTRDPNTIRAARRSVFDC